VGVRLLIVDDNASFLEAARGLLEGEGLTVVGVAGSGSDAVSLAQSARVDVALVDIDLGGESGVAVARLLFEADVDLRIILISAYPEEDLPGVLDQAPVVGFIDKSHLSRRAIERCLSIDGSS
jgi:DNA-binding NarL/FixJ family response regulator